MKASLNVEVLYFDPILTHIGKTPWHVNAKTAQDQTPSKK
jgi:hypothetical protein